MSDLYVPKTVIEDFQMHVAEKYAFMQNVSVYSETPDLMCVVFKSDRRNAPVRLMKASSNSFKKGAEYIINSPSHNQAIKRRIKSAIALKARIDQNTAILIFCHANNWSEL